jgi:hypothetical protein
MARLVRGALTLALVACGGAPPPPTPDAGAPFIAFAADFTGFRSWRSTPGVAPAGAPQPPEAVHGAALTSYLSRAPASGSDAFPVGTLIVKEPSDGGVVGRHAFAMAKRGGGYNSAGATGWEWFELESLDDEHVTVVWRGFGPPSAEAYGGNPTACNDCHVQAVANDFVWTAGFQLTSF